MECFSFVPLQSIIVSHNAAPHWEWNPYMAYALRPLRPVVLLGVTGKSAEAPKLQKHKAQRLPVVEGAMGS